MDEKAQRRKTHHGAPIAALNKQPLPNKRKTVACGEDLGKLLADRVLQRRKTVAFRLLDGDVVIEEDEGAEAEAALVEHEHPPEAAANGGVVPHVLLVIILGCAALSTSEWLATRDKGSGDLILLLDYLYSLSMAAPEAIRARGKAGKWTVSLVFHFGLAAGNVGYSLLTNAAMVTPLPYPVVIVVKNGGLCANLVVGLVLLGRQYTLRQVLAVFVVSGGLIASSLEGQKAKPGAAGASELDSSVAAQAMIGFGLMVSALFVRALWGALQEVAVKRAGATPPVEEMVLFRCFLGLPFLLFKRDSILQHFRLWNATEVAGVPWPGVWGILGLKLCIDYAMRARVTGLVGRTNALTSAIVLTFQRFVSFALSTLVLSPPPGGASLMLWASSVSVLLGAIAYATAPKATKMKIT